MNQRNYKEIAGIIKKRDVYDRSDKVNQYCKGLIKVIALDLADYFEREGNNIYSKSKPFDRGQFFKDCGVE